MTVDEFIAGVEQHTAQKAFFHFTDTRNLPSIRAHGLLSMQQLRSRRISVPAPGGNQWSFDTDVASGMDRYVHLSFLTDHPMAYHAVIGCRIIDVFYLRVRPEVLKTPGAMITCDVANKAGVVPGRPDEMLGKLDLEVMYTRTDWKDKAIQERLRAAHKCEILIPDQVPSRFLENIGNG